MSLIFNLGWFIVGLETAHPMLIWSSFLEPKIYAHIQCMFLFSSKIWANENIAFLDINYIVNKSKPSTSIINKIEKLKDKETKKIKKK